MDNEKNFEQNGTDQTMEKPKKGRKILKGLAIGVAALVTAGTAAVGITRKMLTPSADEPAEEPNQEEEKEVSETDEAPTSED